eukprot:TRINITY_DN92143_c0_g1_i1.p1 TRINITY_DN92143_c0_g1~~TRINITY_DN92143_c0_g1_i1.p1  ORF type:complete len:321 (+),score=93.14 TRINITY_DN92143_c0_g1_i1:128-1090(+)
MAPKKKPAGKEGEPDPFEDFMKVYSKKQKEFETAKMQDVLDIFQRMDEGEEVVNWNFTREFDPMAFRVLFQSLRQGGYNLIEAIRIWKCNGGDESVRSVCSYLNCPEPQPQVKELQFIDNGVTELGCEFLGKTLGPTGNKQVLMLNLNYNKFGTPGMWKLSAGLSMNNTLRVLQLSYCGIQEDGGEPLKYILMFEYGILERLELRGNFLGNTGIVDVFSGARRAKLLSTIDVFDNKFTDTPEVIDSLKDLFGENTCIKNYNLGGNAISDAGASNLVTEMARCGYTHLQQVTISERCSSTTFDALDIQLGASKGKKKKKGK